MALMGEIISPSVPLQIPGKVPSGSEGSALPCLSILAMSPNLHQHYSRVVKLLTVCFIIINRLLLSSFTSL